MDTQVGRPPSRWSNERFTNLSVPSYIPPEAIIHEDGQFLKAFLLRVQSLDITRLLESANSEQFFANVEIVPEYGVNGERTNTPERLLQEKRSRLLDDIVTMLKRHVDSVEANAPTSREIMRKRYFTPEEMVNGAYGAILGARGAVHQDLEKSTKCRIVLAGKGITNPLKDANPNAARVAMENPHVRITAPSEKALQEAMQRVEWILSDDPEAQEFRERNRRRMAQIEGKYDARTWVSSVGRGGAAGANGTAVKSGATDGSGGGKRGREGETENDGDDDDLDAEVMDFLNEL